MTIGGSGMYAITVVLPRIQQEFGVGRSEASFPYSVTLVGFGLGGILMGRLADRFGVMVPVLVGGVALGCGFLLAGSAHSLWQFNLAQALLIGLLGSSATFAPLVADTSQWFSRRRGIALAICMSGNYLAGAVWPPIAQHMVGLWGWREAYAAIGYFCFASILPLAWVLKRRAPVLLAAVGAAAPAAPAAGAQGLAARAAVSERPLNLNPSLLTGLLSVAGLSCCVAMAMPQVHIVAYCSDLGFGATEGAQMLSLMLGAGIVSRLVSGWISDRLGGLITLLIGSLLQLLALTLFLPFKGLVPLYVISGLFGLFQGGIVPCYALIVREYFLPQQAGARVGTVLMATLFGMALGGWMSGAIFDLTGSYRAAFLNGIAFNLLNAAVVVFLLRRAWLLALAHPGDGSRLGAIVECFNRKT
ncbi:MFS transporter [Rhodoferax lacus]|uniref:MFS transporter n=2 Tax=Rhodoferax lacus TaxID=2184758 RepID=A0A3E1REI4_9BURK|nr:MFS transporter [Rhodoferax lacus]